MAEAENPADNRLADRLRKIASEGCDARVADVCLVETGSMPKTPSGKISRSACRSLYEERGS